MVTVDRPVLNAIDYFNLHNLINPGGSRHIAPRDKNYFLNFICKGDRIDMQVNGTDTSLVYEGVLSHHENINRWLVGFVEQIDGNIGITSRRHELQYFEFENGCMQFNPALVQVKIYDPNKNFDQWSPACGLLKRANQWKGALTLEESTQ
ncbi:MAG: hypothetical protein RL557_437 [archaeon]|jgi:hypothetical protein